MTISDKFGSEHNTTMLGTADIHHPDYKLPQGSILEPYDKPVIIEIFDVTYVDKHPLRYQAFDIFDILVHDEIDLELHDNLADALSVDISTLHFIMTIVPTSTKLALPITLKPTFTSNSFEFFSAEEFEKNMLDPMHLLPEVIDAVADLIELNYPELTMPRFGNSG